MTVDFSSDPCKLKESEIFKMLKEKNRKKKEQRFAIPHINIYHTVIKHSNKNSMLFIQK